MNHHLQKWFKVVDYITESKNANNFKNVQTFLDSTSEEPNRTKIDIILKDYGDAFYSYHPNLMWNIIKTTTREYNSYLRIKSILMEDSQIYPKLTELLEWARAYEYYEDTYVGDNAPFVNDKPDIDTLCKAIQKGTKLIYSAIKELKNR